MPHVRPRGPSGCVKSSAAVYAGEMRIVAVADSHLFHDDLVVPDGDVFVHAGDFCRNHYHVYVIELSKEVLREGRFATCNPTVRTRPTLRL